MSIRGDGSLPRDDLPSGRLLFRMRVATHRNGPARLRRWRSRSRGFHLQRPLGASVPDRVITDPERTREKGKERPVQRWVV